MSQVQLLSTESPEYKGIAELNIIYEAGLDSESRPILILCAHNLPDTQTYNYDLILSFILTRLDAFVENDYVLIFLSSPARFRPSWLWLLKAYRSLDRKYKKNLKALYVVHLTRIYRMIFDLANRITSPKFARKLHYLTSLQELYSAVSVSPQFIPKPVVDYDDQLPPKPPAKRHSYFEGTTSFSQPSLAFGRSLEELAEIDKWDASKGPYIPNIVQLLVEELRNRGLNREGLFRKSPASDQLREAKEAFNRGTTVDLSKYDVEVSAALLKVFLRELPEPLIAQSFCSVLDTQSSGPDRVSRLKEKLGSAYQNKPHQRALLRYIIHFLGEVAAHSDTNRMNVHNLAVVCTPNLVREGSKEDKESAVPSNEQEAMATAALYLKQMNQGMELVELLILERERVF